MKSPDNSKKFDTIIGEGEIFDVETRHFYKGSIGILDGVITEVGDHLDLNQSDKYVDAKGYMVLPGFVDFHTHCYWGGTSLGINPSKVGPITGVTTFVDLGSAGAGNFEGFFEHVIKSSTVPIYAFLNLSYIGLTPIGDTEVRFGELFDERLIDVHSVRKTIEKYPDAIKGIKIRLGPTTSGKNGYYALNVATQLSLELGLPLVVHATSPPPFLNEILMALKPGDVLTHCYNQDHFIRIIASDKKVKQSVLDARSRGVLFDVGHGVSCFSFDMASSSIEDQFFPDIISSDLHAYNINGPVFDLPTTLSKFLSLGMPLEEALYRATLAPARVIRMEHLVGSLAVGKRADIVIAKYSENKEILWDSQQREMLGYKLQIVSTYFSGVELPLYDDGRNEAKWKPGVPIMFKNTERKF